MGDYLAKHPNRCMPYGFPPLKDEELQTIAGWLAQGGAGPEGAAKAELMHIPREDQEKIDQWESFDEFQEVFNKSDPVQAGLFDLNRYYYRARVVQ